MCILRGEIVDAPVSRSAIAPRPIAWPIFRSMNELVLPSQWNHSSCLTPQRWGKLTGAFRGTLGAFLKTSRRTLPKASMRPGPGLVTCSPLVCRLASVLKNSRRFNSKP